MLAKRGTQTDTPCLHPERQRTRERIVVGLGHEDPGIAQLFRIARPLDDLVDRAVGHYREGERRLRHRTTSFQMLRAARRAA
jgi:hypothetical protein